MKLEEVAESKSSSIRQLLQDLGPKGIMALIGAMGITWMLLQGNLGAGLFTGRMPPADTSDAQASLILELFSSISGVEVERVLIGRDTVQESQSTVFATRAMAETEVIRSVVVLYEGTILRPHDLTLAISRLLGVDYHQIDFINLSNIGGN